MPSLYITEPGASLEKEAERLFVTKADEVLLAVPLMRVDQVVIVGNVAVTTPALNALLDRNIGLVFLTSTGTFRGRLTADRARQVALRREQYRRAEDATFGLRLARAIVAGKIRNCRTLCMRLETTNRDPFVAKVLDDLLALLARAGEAATRDELLGLEGLAARRYFAAVRHLLRPPWVFERRRRRPPPDPVNALFLLAYVLLHESCRAAVEAAGLARSAATSTSRTTGENRWRST